MNNAHRQETTSEIPPAIIFTDSAAYKVYELIKEEGNLKLMLRAYVTGGGCSGFQYGFTFDEVINADDMVIEKWIKKLAANDENETDEEDDDGGEGGEGGVILIKLLVDSMSYQYLAGAEIDYKVDLNGEQFIIRNPNAKTTCGCGSSFSA